MDVPIETLVEQARNGDSDALEGVIRQIQDRIYGLAIRMLWHPEDAEDATQEILVKIVTHLGDFRQESTFTTWCYRIAGNHLLTTRKRRAEKMELTFTKYEEDIARAMEYGVSCSAPEPEQDLLVKELMIGCLQGVMLCLDRSLRMTYLLGEVYEVDSHKGADILGITPESFRKRLSRARALIQGFLVKNCGLVNPSNACTCTRQLPYSLKTGLVNPRRLLFATHPRSSRQDSGMPEGLGESDEFQRVKALLRDPEYAAPHVFVERMRALIDSGSIRFSQPIH